MFAYDVMLREECDSMNNKSEVPEGFTLSLALVDALPVLFFGIATLVLGLKIGSALFAIGALLCFVGGAGKVAWKFVIALAHKNIPLLAKQMQFLMPVGFLLMIVGAIICGQRTLQVFGALASMPSIILMILWLACMCAMGYFASHADQNNARSNWIEQLTNTAGQAALLFAILLVA